ncbi:hypothetical protein SPHV1_2180055 [Novosphingobium sp. KN65.2]|nr:hypothetical protein SPHV1_2180055 [Novosphingobium sp. KN65.2]
MSFNYGGLHYYVHSPVPSLLSRDPLKFY